MAGTASSATGSPAFGRLPFAAFLCNSAEHSVVSGLRLTTRHCVAKNLHVRFHVLDDPDDQREAVLSSARAVIWDGHGGWVDDAPAVDGARLDKVLTSTDRITAEVLVVGCCWGGTADYTEFVSRHISAPLVYIGCEERAGKTHGSKVFPPLMDALASRSPGAASEGLRDVLQRALDTAVAEHPELGKSAWKAAVLKPEDS
jgi:hypothetical protein